MDVKVAMRETAAFIDGTSWAEVETIEGTGKLHLHDMVKQVLSWDLSDEKTERRAHRWLGWLQAMVVAGRGASLEQMKAINKAA